MSSLCPQVLQAVEEARKASVGASLEKPLTSKRTATFEPVDEQAESDSLQEVSRLLTRYHSVAEVFPFCWHLHVLLQVRSLNPFL